MSAEFITKRESKFTWVSTIAVYPIANDLNNALSSAIISSLTDNAPLRIVDRLDLQQVIEEQKFALSGFVDSRHVKKIGQLLPLDALLSGSVQTDEVQGQKRVLKVYMKLTDVNTAEILWSSVIEAEAPISKGQFHLRNQFFLLILFIVATIIVIAVRKSAL